MIINQSHDGTPPCFATFVAETASFLGRGGCGRGLAAVGAVGGSVSVATPANLTGNVGSAFEGEVAGCALEGAGDGCALDGAVDGSALDGAVDGSALDGAVDGSALAGTVGGSARDASDAEADGPDWDGVAIAAGPWDDAWCEGIAAGDADCVGVGTTGVGCD